MPSELGRLIRETREAKGIGLRELARRIGKSPSFVVGVETGDRPPSAAEDTLRAIALELGLNADRVITLAGKVPEDAAPADALEAALFRRVREMPEAEKRRMLRELDGSAGKD